MSIVHQYKTQLDQERPFDYNSGMTDLEVL